MTDRNDNLFRMASFELRSAGGDGRTLEGYGAVFNSPTIIEDRVGRFTETVAPGAFTRSLEERTPVLQFDHGRHPLIGSIPLGVISDIREDNHGLYVRARLTDNWLIDPIRDSIRDGAINGMSFRFSIPDGGDQWDDDVRTITDLDLFEVGPVVFPAYDTTSVGVRNALADLVEQRMNAATSPPVPDDAPGSDSVEEPEGMETHHLSGMSRNARQRALLIHNIYDPGGHPHA